jgi:hypothetical protein
VPVIVPTVELPLATPATVQVTLVSLVPETEATKPSVTPTPTLAVEVEGVVIETETTVGGGVLPPPPPPPPQPAIAASRLKVIPKTHDLVRNTGLIDGSPIKNLRMASALLYTVESTYVQRASKAIGGKWRFPLVTT